MTRTGFATALFVFTGSTLFSQTPSTPPQSPPTPPTFRAEARLVPVDVRVVDQNGRPITDLRREDFSVLENGVPQEVREFATHRFTPVATTNQATGTSPFAVTREPAADLAPANRRIFLIVFGRGDVQGIGKGIDGVIDFIRRRTLPQDLVAVLGWNRATEFTTDHAGIVEVVERFKASYRSIDQKLNIRNDMVAAAYQEQAGLATLRISPALQAEIDAVFSRTGAGNVRTVVPGQSPNATRIAQDTRRDTEALQAGLSAAVAAEDNAAQLSAQASLDEFVAGGLQTMEDLGNLYLAIDYLRYLDGEKHLVFVSEVGLATGREDDDRDLGARAANARVAIDYVHTGGQPPMRMGISAPVTVAGVAPGLLPPPARPQQPPFAAQTARQLATLTGGTSYWNRLPNAGADLGRMDEVTRFQYVLGYYSTRPLDGRRRDIVVRVNRPGVTLMYRRAYYATAELAPFDRERVLTSSRLSTAAMYPDVIADIPTRLSAWVQPSGEVTTELRVDPAGLLMSKEGGRNTATVVMSIFYFDANDQVIRQAWGKIPVTLTDSELETFSASWVPVTMKVSLATAPAAVKVVLYQYAADRVGSAFTRITTP